MRARLAATVTAAILIVPLAAATAAGASLSPAPHPDKTCPASANNILDHCE